MLLSRCTVLVFGAALSVGLPAALRTADSVEPAPERVSASPKLGAHGIASYQLIRKDPGGGALWWLYDASPNVVGSLEYRPSGAGAGKPAETYVLTFKDDKLVLGIGGTRTVIQVNDARPVAFVYEEARNRVVPDPSNAKGGLEAALPLLRILGAVIDEVMRKPDPAAAAGSGAPPKGAGAPVPLEGEPPCNGEWYFRPGWGVFPTRSWACSDATQRVNVACADASTGACGSCCELLECDCQCIPNTDIACACARWGKACAPGCPPENIPAHACRPENCSVDCFQVARGRVPAGLRVIGGSCNWAVDCSCDAWFNTCNPANNNRDTVVYSEIQSCPAPCPPACEGASGGDAPSSCGNTCGSGMCFDPNPTCCFNEYCGPPDADCCSDGGSCPSGWNCCDDGTSSCCPNGSQCCWLEDGPMCCEWGGDQRPDSSTAPLRTLPRLQKNHAPLMPKNPKE